MNDLYSDSMEHRHHGYAGCESETNKIDWLTDQMMAVSRAVNGRNL